MDAARTLNAQLARITDQAAILRREQMADARSGIRVVSRDNLKLLQNVLWTLLAIAIIVSAVALIVTLRQKKNAS